MNKILMKLENEYKAISDLKSKHPFELNKWTAVKNIGILMLIFALLFSIMGYITGELDNLHYVVLSVNTSIIGPFILWTISKEIKFQNHYKLEYRFLNLIIYKSIGLITLTLLSNSIVILLYFQSIISIQFFLLLIAVSTLFIVAIYFIQNRFKLKQNYAGNILFNAIIVALLYILLFNSLGIEMIVLNYVVSTVMIALIYLIANTIQLHSLIASDTLVFKFLSTIVFVALALIINNGDYIKKHSDYILHEEWRHSKVNVINHLEHLKPYSDSIHKSNIFVNDDHIYLALYEEVLILNHDFEIVRTVTRPEDLYKFYLDDGRLKGTASGAHLVNKHDSSWRIVYYLDDNFEFQEEILLHADDFYPTYSLNNELITFGYNKRGYILKHHGDFEFTIYTSDHYEPNQIIYQDGRHVIYTRNGKLTRDISYLRFQDEGGWYSNGKKLIVGEQDFTIVDFKEYITGNEKNLIRYDIEDRLNISFDYYGLSSFQYDILSFDYYKNRYFIQVDADGRGGRRQVTLVLNQSGEELGLLDNKSYHSSQNNTFPYIGEELILYFDLHGDMKVVDNENPLTYTFKGLTGNMNHVLLFTNLLIVISFKKRIKLM